MPESLKIIYKMTIELSYQSKNGSDNIHNCKRVLLYGFFKPI
jgi:hypothetical protein